MVLNGREIERKYELPARGELPELVDLPGVRSASDPEVLTLEAVYFDTQDLRLARRGVTLRRRSGGDDEGWHLKLPAGRDTREEVHAPLGRGTRAVPGVLADLVRAYARGKRLAPVARIATERTRRRLLDDTGAVLAEVVADEVSAQTLGESTTLSSWSEVEVELAGGDVSLLDAVEEQLRRAGVHRAGSQSKLARLLADRLPTARTATGAAGARAARGDRKPRGRKVTAGEVVVGYLRDQVQTMLDYDPRVRRDEPDAVHKMRVATRRLRSALRTYRQLVDPAATAQLSAELRWFAAVLGEVRDREVLRARLEDVIGTLPAELVVGPVEARITSHLAGEQAKARADLLTAMRSRRYYALLDALDALLADPPLTAHGRRPAAKLVPQLVAKERKRVDAKVRAATRHPAGADLDEAVHTARKAAKRARYAAELAKPVLGKKARKLATRMEDTQETLGAHHDSVVTRAVLRELAMQAHLSGENGFTYGLLHGRQQSTAAAIEARLTRHRTG